MTSSDNFRKGFYTLFDDYYNHFLKNFSTFSCNPHSYSYSEVNQTFISEK